MNSTSSQTEATRQALVKVYRNLPALEKAIVQLFSVIYEPINRTTFVNCWNHIEAKDWGEKRFTAPTMKPYLDRLLELGILLQPPGLGPQCNPLIVEVATRNAVQMGRFETFVAAVEKGSPLPQHWTKTGAYVFATDRQLIRVVRIGLYRKDIKFINKQLEDYYKYTYQRDKISLHEIIQEVCDNPFDAEWFRTLPPELFEIAILSIINNSLINLTPSGEALQLLQERCANLKSPPSIVLYGILVEQLICRGQLQTAQKVLDQFPAPYQDHADSLRGWLAFLQGNDGKAIEAYRLGLQVLKKGTGKRKLFYQGMAGLFFVMALLKEGSAASLKEAEDYCSIAKQARHWLSSTYLALENVLKVQQGDLVRKDWMVNMSIASYEAGNSIETLFCSLCLYWVDAEKAKKHLPRLLEPYYEQAEAAAFNWLAKTAGEIVTRLKPRSPMTKRSSALSLQGSPRSLVDLIQPQEAWELCLNALMSLQKEPAPTPDKSVATQRLAWMVTFYPSGCTLQPREQSLSAKGEWGKGRPIALKRLKSNPGEFDYLTPQDLRVCSHIKSYTHGWRNQVDYMFGERAILDLIGHPYVFWEESPTTRIEVVKGEPELLVKKGKGDVLTLQFSPQLKDKNPIIVKESPTRLKVIEITPEHRRIAEILGQQNRLEVPAGAKERVLGAINAVSSVVTVHSDIGGGVASEEVPADAHPHIHLLPAGTGLKVAVLARPFAQAGPYYRPGTGGETVLAEVDGKRLQTTRNLKEEKKLANAAIASCSTLAEYERQDNEWLVEDPEDCLELLLELQGLGDQAVVEWPEGEKMRVNYQADLKNFKMSIKRQNDWFATEGELQIGSDRVLDMQQLMQLLEQTPSRFIPLGDGQFLALTQELRKRLDELRAFSERSGKNLKLHPLAAVAVEDWMEEVGTLKADKYWKSHISRLKEVQNLDPKLPSTLQADLRDYQLDGFRWLARLAHWGVGACLADDMGLGKTVQALALILTRAPEGPTLIVAPTSVGMNWISEAQRFAPTLNPMQFGSGDRQKLLDQLQPFDLLVCTYGLLQQDEVAEMLAKVKWQTIVLDEAQSIKNFATKRSQAAMNLQGGFKLLTTGTPIENHLGELWNLFRFINPGLLGSLESFNQRFANPIERYGDQQARTCLKKLIQPFILRRTKNQVLQELPSRTEILLQVELSQQEMAFYEALRREAITKLSESDAAAGAKHLQVLAEIMKLRRACCNTGLVKPELALPSSKLNLFGEVLAELLENKHKALVFSQFVDHLHLIRNYLDQQKVSYQYLDGSTPANERKKRVNAFQAGEGDVFLISLKAGGTGLNLTAADYVIHMDPWWNPAVEDQASDRAHRIGQQRPVTIYRLVAKHTIEEKIVDLHQHKRDLADSLLEGTEMSGKISTEELLRLISEG
ncbi:MAG: DEAD/DEAH box helicase [Leptolyngbyaceae cyanobacterium bins.59]|nr:DEAD/DEAH box helicase [Leptolyngbyaceae cyanobacterium bins.59]